MQSHCSFSIPVTFGWKDSSAGYSTMYNNTSWAFVFSSVATFSFINNQQNQGRSQGGPGVHMTPPLCKPFCKQTTCNIQVTIWWVPSVWLNVTLLWKILPTPMVQIPIAPFHYRILLHVSTIFHRSNFNIHSIIHNIGISS